MLENNKYNQIDVMNSINNLTITHNSDMSSVNTRLNSLTSKINGLSQRLDSVERFDATTTNSYTGVTITIPASTYFCLSGYAASESSYGRKVSINRSSTDALSVISHNSTSENIVLLSTTICGITGTTEVTNYLWASYSAAGKNVGYLRGFYINY